jgi:YgiT-type zinc finger domain-containing protein
VISFLLAAAISSCYQKTSHPNLDHETHERPRKARNAFVCFALFRAVRVPSRPVALEDLTMKCIICHSTDISLRRVNEQLSRGQDMILVPVDVLVCNNCGERYYDRRTMQKLEEIEDAVNAGHVSLERVGEVMRVRPELVPA